MITSAQGKLDDLAIELRTGLERYQRARANLATMLQSGKYFTGRPLDSTEIASFSKQLIALDAKFEVYVDLSNMLQA